MKSNFTESDIAGMLKTIPAPLPYPEWMRVVSAVYSVLPFAPGARLLQAWSPETVPGEYANKHKARMEQVTIGSLVHIAQRNGWKGEAGWKGKVRFAPTPARTPELIAAAAALPLPSWLCRPPATQSNQPLALEPLLTAKAKEKELERKTTCQISDKSLLPVMDTKRELAKVANVSHDTIPKARPAQRPPAPAGYCNECWWTWSRALRPGSCICSGDVAVRPGGPKLPRNPQQASATA